MEGSTLLSLSSASSYEPHVTLRQIISPRITNSPVPKQISSPIFRSTISNEMNSSANPHKMISTPATRTFFREYFSKMRERASQNSGNPAATANMRQIRLFFRMRNGTKPVASKLTIQPRLMNLETPQVMESGSPGSPSTSTIALINPATATTTTNRPILSPIWSVVIAFANYKLQARTVKVSLPMSMSQHAVRQHQLFFKYCRNPFEQNRSRIKQNSKKPIRTAVNVSRRFMFLLSQMPGQSCGSQQQPFEM